MQSGIELLEDLPGAGAPVVRQRAYRGLPAAAAPADQSERD